MGNDSVGYKKPPKSTQFQKGRSGNPGGRPKVTQTFTAALDAVLNEKITVTVRGQKVERTFLDVIAMKLVTKAADGNLAAMAMIEKNQTRAQLIKKSHEPSDDEVPVFNVTMDFDEGPIFPPDMWRLCQEMECTQQGVPSQLEPIHTTSKVLMEHLRKTQDSLPDSLKYLIK